MEHLRPDVEHVTLTASPRLDSLPLEARPFLIAIGVALTILLLATYKFVAIALSDIFGPPHDGLVEVYGWVACLAFVSTEVIGIAYFCRKKSTVISGCAEWLIAITVGLFAVPIVFAMIVISIRVFGLRD